MNGGERTAMGIVLAGKGKSNWTVFLDQSKAFDTANQPLINLNDLIDALYIMQSYLSEVLHFTYGMLHDQRSIHSLLLFLIVLMIGPLWSSILS